MKFFCQRQNHRVGAKDRFDPKWLEEARRRPSAVVHTVDEAVDWLVEQTAEVVRGLTERQRQRSGWAEDERWERMPDQWRAELERGQLAGSIIIAGDGWVTHTHVIPETRAR